jgi:hypothetical protein
MSPFLQIWPSRSIIKSNLRPERGPRSVTATLQGSGHGRDIAFKSGQRPGAPSRCTTLSVTRDFYGHSGAKGGRGLPVKPGG